jgi:hypothetical protein
VMSAWTLSFFPHVYTPPPAKPSARRNRNRMKHRLPAAACEAVSKSLPSDPPGKCRSAHIKQVARAALHCVHGPVAFPLCLHR